MPNPSSPISLASLFSGCGGMDLGYEGGFTVHKTALTKLERDSAKSLGKHGFVKLNSLPFETDFACDVS